MNDDSRQVYDVFNTEIGKLILDLRNYCIQEKDNCLVSEDFSVFRDSLHKYDKPLLLIDQTVDFLLDINTNDRDLYEAVFYSDDISEANYVKINYQIDKTILPIVKYNISSELRKKYPVFSKFKGIALDQSKVEYRVKEPIKAVWKTRTKPVEVNLRTEKRSILDPDFFDFECFSISEIVNKGPLFVWQYCDEDIKELHKIKPFRDLF